MEIKKGKRYNPEEYPMAGDSHLITLNSNLLCVVDLNTSGPEPKYDDILQLCILPLNSNLTPFKGIVPFAVDLKPKRPENFDYERLDSYYFNTENVTKILQDGLDPYVAADRFDAWFEKFRLKHNKKLSILCYNWAFKRAFFEEFFGPLTYDKYFDYRYRDILPAALFCNDQAEFSQEQIPYPKQNIAHLASQAQIEHEKRMRDPILNCVAIAEIYKHMLTFTNRSILKWSK
jgi:hypothetical protein